MYFAFTCTHTLITVKNITMNRNIFKPGTCA